jgi:SAM-dependent methyltransferase
MFFSVFHFKFPTRSDFPFQGSSNKRVPALVLAGQGMSRPELTGEASSYYNLKEARKYDSSSRMIGVQREITERAIELLKLPKGKPCFILDVGCGSGLSGRVLEEYGHVWVGCDVSYDMLKVANERIRGSNHKKYEENADIMEEEDDDSYHSDDDDEDENENKKNGEQKSSVGDLMHHVRDSLFLFCCHPCSSAPSLPLNIHTIFSFLLLLLFSRPHLNYTRIWEQDYHSVQHHLMPVYLYLRCNGYVIPIREVKSQSGV